MPIRLHLLEKRGQEVRPLWPHPVRFDDATQEQRDAANLRTLFPDEPVLDCESQEQADRTEAGLRERGWAFSRWDTGSRGAHFHLRFRDLGALEKPERNRIRGVLIELFGADPAKASEDAFIALEGRPHFKTGRSKSLVCGTAGQNLLPAAAVAEAERRTRAARAAPSRGISRAEALRGPVLAYCLAHEIPDGTARYPVLLKNLGILLAQAALTEEERAELVQRLAANMPGRSERDLWGWIRSAQSGRFTRYNQRELLRWFRRNNLPLRETGTE